MPPPLTEAQFWAKYLVPFDSVSRCWEFTGGKRKGYGFCRWQGRLVLAHRLAFFLCNGSWPAAVMHTCDNPGCGNPAHLKAGTQRLNHADMVAKGRHARGERAGRAKLCDLCVEVIRVVYAAGAATQTELGRWFGVDHTQIGHIVRKEQRT